MTGRRARPTYEQRMSRAFQYVPGHVGGRVASAQPVVRRDGTLRRPSIGSASAASPTPATFLNYQYASADWSIGATTMDLSVFFLTDFPSGHANDWFEDGDTCVLMASQWDRALTAPAGWTTIVTDSIGKLHYLVAVQDAVALDATVTLGCASGATVGNIWLMAFTDVPSGYAMNIDSITESAAASTHGIPAGPSGWLNPLSALFTSDDTALHIITSADLTDGVDFEYADERYTGYPAAAPEHATITTYPGVVVPPEAEAASMGNPPSWDTLESVTSVSFVLGFAP